MTRPACLNEFTAPRQLKRWGACPRSRSRKQDNAFKDENSNTAYETLSVVSPFGGLGVRTVRGT
jgi:hypothetical protein